VLGSATRTLIDSTLAAYRLNALIRPTSDPAFRVDTVRGDNFGTSASGVPAQAGYPHLTVPMGAVSGLPVGLSFIGPAWSDARLLSLGYAFEQAARAGIQPTFAPSVATRPEIAAAYAPLP